VFVPKEVKIARIEGRIQFACATPPHQLGSNLVKHANVAAGNPEAPLSGPRLQLADHASLPQL
jgi:hypothetical protein